MKRFLSLMLVAIMLLSTLMLTSCDPITEVKDFVNKILGKDRYTITEEEWNTAFDGSNFTAIAEISGIKVTMAVDYPIIKYEIVASASPEYNETIYADLQNGYYLAKAGTGSFERYEIGSEVDVSDVSLKSLGMFEDLKYSDLTYDKDGKCYTAKTEDSYYTFKFENGKLVSVEAIPTDVSISASEVYTNIGTTTVEMPK